MTGARMPKFGSHAGTTSSQFLSEPVKALEDSGPRCNMEEMACAVGSDTAPVQDLVLATLVASYTVTS